MMAVRQCHYTALKFATRAGGSNEEQPPSTKKVVMVAVRLAAELSGRLRQDPGAAAVG
jgi:hypothetical protein